MKHLKIDVKSNDNELINLLEAVRASEGGIKQAYTAAVELLRDKKLKLEPGIEVKIKQYNGQINILLFELLEDTCQKLNRSKKSVLIELLEILNEKKAG